MPEFYIIIGGFIMTEKQHIWHLRRHLGARDGALVGEELVLSPKDIIPVEGVLYLDDVSEIRAFVGNGLGDDGQAHLQAGEAAKARAVGRTLYVSEDVEKLTRGDSPLPRASETSYHIWVGMVAAFAEKHLNVVNGDKPDANEKWRMSQIGLNKRTGKPIFFKGLAETRYTSSRKDEHGERIEDDGNELVALAYNSTVNPHFANSYKLMTELGLRGDSRSEHPADLGERGLRWAMNYLMQTDVLLSGSHQPNMESILAYLLKGREDIGSDAHEVWANAGGEVDMGGGLELRVYEKGGQITRAEFRRTEPKEWRNDPGMGVDYDGTRLMDKAIHLEGVSMDVLRNYAP